jgi:glycosyltransferase involved in cell wall biosynthesis
MILARVLEDKFVIGVFGRNAARKQPARVMLAISSLKAQGKTKDMAFYFHCQPLDDFSLDGWDLREVAQQLDIEELVIFPETGFNQLTGTPYLSSMQTASPLTVKMPESYHHFNYVERLNCCDVVINASFSGGFEMGTIEAQACGIPVAITNDYGSMAEVAGNGALLLEAADIGIWKTGARQHFVSSGTIAGAIIRLYSDSSLYTELREKGLANAKKYNHQVMGESIAKIVTARLISI